MIRTFAFKNYFSFKEGAEISFLFDKTVPNSVSNGSKVGTVLGIKGANGSGKTNIIKALSFLRLFATVSAQTSSKKIINPIVTHFNNENETVFNIEMELSGTVYTYEISLTVNHVIRETVHKKRKRNVLLVQRDYNKITKTTSEYRELKNINLRSDASLISSIKNFNFTANMVDLQKIYDFFRNINSNVDLTGYVNIEDNQTISDVSEKYLLNETLFEFVKKYIQKADNSISDISIIDRIKDNGEKEYLPVFWHTYNDSQTNIVFSYESSGVKTLFKTLYYYWDVISKGGVLCMDEFDIHLHALLLPDLVDLFLDKNINTNGAQLIFTAHISEIIDKLGKYRTILVNKEGSESYCYRLDEVPGSLVRNDRAITPLYLEGKIGGVPKNNG